MTLNGAIKQLHDLRCSEDIPFYYKPTIAEIINVLLMDVQEVDHGEWIKVNDDDSLFRCSVCGELSCCASKYCGDCGAKMENEE